MWWRGCDGMHEGGAAAAAVAFFLGLDFLGSAVGPRLVWRRGVHVVLAAAAVTHACSRSPHACTPRDEGRRGHGWL